MQTCVVVEQDQNLVLYCREVANEIVSRRIVMAGQFQAVSRADAIEILGRSRYERLLRDPVRHQGPVPGTHYPWNVVDYLSCEHPGGKSRRTGTIGS